MSCDPNYQVRLQCLKSLVPTKKTLSAIVERTRDVNDTVRRLAYNNIAEKVSVKAFTISQRLRLLQNGLNDRSGDF